MSRLWRTRSAVLSLALAVLLIMVLVVAFRAIGVMRGCDACEDQHNVLGFSLRLNVVDESGRGVPNATVTLHGEKTERLNGDQGGAVSTPVLRGPVLAVVEAPGHLPEPVPLGKSDEDGPVTVKLFDRKQGRFAMHSAGDVMFGRRYADPDDGGPLVPRQDAARGAEHVVSAFAPAFAAADFRTVNLESVVSDLPADKAYPQKRFILKSASATTAGLKALGVDCAVLANNHSRDFLDQGVADTRTALAEAGIGMVGADVTPEGAAVPFRRTVNGTAVAVAAFTSVDGDFVNGAYPDAAEPRPADATLDDTWRYDARPWGFGSVATAPRRIGQAWDAYRKAESAAPDAVKAEMWKSLVAVYPELQDWVARRGHGGAARWDPVASPARIAQLSAQNQLTVVQLHAGFQFQDAASDNVRSMARAAIDAGADIVIGHHPHVLQGVEWYKGHLIVYSLGNFVFDQNFLSTFASVVVRTVWDGDQLLEARLLPLELVDYRPVPLTGDAARRVLGRIWELGLMPASTDRDRTGAVRAYLKQPAPDVIPAQLVVEHNTGRITAASTLPETRTVAVPAHGVVDLAAPGTLVRPVSGDGVEVGRDLFGWGGFEDETADGAADSATHWKAGGTTESSQVGPTPQGQRFLRLSAAAGKSVQTRAIARIPVPRHRTYTPNSAPADPEPSYSVRAMVRGTGSESAYFRFDVYHFDDSDPTEDPDSVVLTTITRAVQVPSDGGWHQVTIDLTTNDLTTPDGAGNMIMMYTGLNRAPDGRAGALDLDDVRFVEWRAASGMTGSFGAFDLARNPADVPRQLPAEVKRP
ncbi:CapA family protein [Lentzea aerocolonigenes]|uniref:CapA family protein n=1 Tax=Lentzea aerocolonigenes TaxID=68170 RepID=UPI000AF5B384|nr:CapA family protein [Lentzea aerocolonigenes]